MRDCPQEPVYHAEGDVWIHTRMVCEAMAALPAWRELSAQDRETVFAAALLHDVAKPRCTRRENGRITSRGHSGAGAILARRILWELGVPFSQRELVCGLVRYHQVPYVLIDCRDAVRLAFETSVAARRTDWLALLAEADIRGRVCADQDKLLDNVTLFADFCRDHECWGQAYAFGSGLSRFLYFRNPDRDPAYVAYDESRFTVTLMSGLPGAGKDHWIAEHAAGVPVVSLDEWRRKLRIGPGEEQGAVIQAAKEEARQWLRTETPFVWNATNLTRETRGRNIALFRDYGANVRIVYVEAPAARLWAQNRSRAEAVPEIAIHRMLDKWEVPDETEAPAVEYAVAGC